MPEFRYRIAMLVDGVLGVGEDRLTYRQGLRRLSVPLAAVRAFGVRDRGGPVAGILSSELIVRTEAAPGRFRVRRIPWNPGELGCIEALAALRARLPDADATGLPWEQAAARLGVTTRGWREWLSEPLSTIGLGLIGSASVAGVLMQWMRERGTPHERTARAVLLVAMFGIGVVLLVTGWVRSRGRQPPRS